MEPKDKLAVYALTAPGAALGLTIKRALAGFGPVTLFLPERLAGEVPAGEGGLEFYARLQEPLSRNFRQYQGHIIIGATGLVVRLIAPLLDSKTTDPAVVTLGQDGRFVISLVSGHLGGANKLASEVARLLGGQAVINTATDIEGRPAMEVLARDCDLHLENYAALARISRILVEGGRVAVYDPGNYLAPSLKPWPEAFDIWRKRPAQEAGPMVWVDYRTEDLPPEILLLRPRVLAVGLGCHRGIASALVENFLREVFAKQRLSIHSIGLLGTVETRREEPAFLDLSHKLGRPLLIYTKEELAGVSTPSPSAIVENQIGVPSVCEAAALLAARTDSLVIEKRKGEMTTLAAALISWK